MTRTLEGTVVALWRYPVSSLAGECLPGSRLTREGLERDRAFGLFDPETGDIVFPSISKRDNVAPAASARFDAAGGLELSVDGQRWASSDDPELLRDLALHFGRKVLPWRYGTELAGRTATPRYERGPIHLMSQQALDALQALLPDSRIDLRRFRPNILVDLPDAGVPVPEYGLIGQEFSIGDLRLRGVRPRDRCSFVTLAQQRFPEDRAVLRMLISRFEKNFGILCDVLDEGEIAVGAALAAEVEEPVIAPIVIVGAGQAGAMTARALREMGATAPIDLFGDERHAPYERPPLSKAEFARGAPNPGASSPVLSAREAQDLGVALHLGTRVTRIDRARRAVETDDGARHPYARLVLATGGSARRVPRLGRGHGRVHAVRTLEDAERLHRSLATSRSVFVLGGGWLGLEVAATARGLGRDVTLFARQPRLCARVLPVVVSDFLTGLHAEHGVTLRLGREPEFAEYDDRVDVVVDGRRESADMLVVAIGMVANDALAAAAGLACADGVLTDPDGATDDADVFAVGDVARQRLPDRPDGVRFESWHNANDQARRAAGRLLARDPEPVPPPRFWSHQYEAMLQVTGMPDPGAVPSLAEGGPNPYWEFEGFAIGVNQPKRLRAFAARLAQASAEPIVTAAPVAAIPAATEKLMRVRFGSADAVREGEILRVETAEAGGVAVVRREGRLFAVHDTCPHANASLSQGFLEGDRIVCPLHFAEFDLRNGEAHNAPPGCAAVACFPVEQEGNDLFLLVPQGPS